MRHDAAELMPRSRARAGVRAWARAALLVSLLVAVVPARAKSPDSGRPKLGPLAVTIQQSHAYLRTHEAPDYWALSPYYVPQFSGSACSVATIAMLVNALRGLPPLANDELVTQAGLLKAVGSGEWEADTAPDGDGITFDEFASYLGLSLKAYDLAADVEVFRPGDDSPATRAALGAILTSNEDSASDLVVVYFNQGVVTGDWDGPHLSPVGAYDGDLHQVLIMDVDRQFYVPYWTSEETLLRAMLRPAPAKEGRLAGQTGGVLRVSLRPAGRTTEVPAGDGGQGQPDGESVRSRP